MTTITQRLTDNRPLLLDGATGTELEYRGVPMNDDIWSGLAIATHPDVVRQVHIDYIQAGAEVIITNTFASGRHMLRAAGVESQTAAINRQAAQLAHQARDEAAEHPVWIAGSISLMTAGDDNASMPSLREMHAHCTEQAELLAGAGVDLLILEMMRDIDYSSSAVEAATATGLPVWVGFSCACAQDGSLILSPTIEQEIPLSAGVAAVMAVGGSLAAVMHSDINITGPALAEVQAVWSGPTGAYPESGYFIMPNWQFVDIISPQAFVGKAMEWVAQGAKLVGGCCGIGLPHIRALAERLHSGTQV